MSDDNLRKYYANQLKRQEYLKIGFKQGFEAGYAKAKEDFGRPQGEWIFKNGKYRCTACGEKAIYVYPGLSTIPKAILTDFCPKCGVQMNAKQLEMIRKREGLEEE